MEQDNTQTKTTKKSTARYVFFGFLVVGLIALIISVCMANVNVSVDVTMRRYVIGSGTEITSKDNADEGKSGLTGVKVNLIRDLDSAKDNDKVVKGIEEADSKASIALVLYIMAVLLGAGLVAINAIQIFCGKNNKGLTAGKIVCFSLLLAATIFAVFMYFGTIHNLEYALEHALSAKTGDIEIISTAHVGSSLAIVFGVISIVVSIVGFIVTSVTNRNLHRQTANN